jgi:6-phosphogluconolactonase
MKELVTVPDAAELARYAGARVAAIVSAVPEGRDVAIALSGGNTPKALYELLSTDPACRLIGWERVNFFFGDERLAPADSSESNYRMANEALLRPLGIDDARIFRWRTELEDPELIASDYENQLDSYFHGLPKFDLFLLGLGDDGHTASLFPKTAALAESERFAVPNRVPKLDAWRLTLTFPVINNSSNIVFLVSGSAKAAVLKDVLEGPFDPDSFPAQMVQPFDGDLLWLADRDAAERLNKNAFTIHN